MGSRSRPAPQARRRTLTTVAVLAVGASGVLAGCTGLGVGGVTVDEVALWGPSTGGGDSALLEGTLTVDDGCVYVTDPSGTRWLPVFNEDKVGWDGQTLRTPDGAFVDGDEISMGGGVVVESVPSGWEPPDEMHVPASCEPESVWSGAR